MYDKVLVPLDGNPTSDRGFEEAVAVARVMKSSLVLTHVIDTVRLAVDMVPPSTWQDVSHALLGSDAERLVRRCPVPVLLVRHPDAPKD